MAELYNKYRPAIFDEVVGQDHAIKSLKDCFTKDEKPHAYLFTGNSGTGKTTLARIIANELNCDEANILEIDAASHGKVEDIRELISSLQYATFGDNPTKFIIIDEAHALSKSAWQTFLKTIEEPPKHVYFAFCTTESDKVPETIKTRCHTYHLKDVSSDDIFDLVSVVAEAENFNLNTKQLQAIAKASRGSPRRSLVYLSKCSGCETLEEVRSVLEEPDEEGEIIELCRLLAGRVQPQWRKIITILKSLESQNPESIRLIIVNYMAKALLNTRTDKEAYKLLEILNAFSTPCNQNEKMAPILLAFGSIVFGNLESSDES